MSPKSQSKQQGVGLWIITLRLIYFIYNSIVEQNAYNLRYVTNFDLN